MKNYNNYIKKLEASNDAAIKDELRYLSDEEIETGYDDFKIRQINFDSDVTGFLDIEFPHGEDKFDNFLIYYWEDDLKKSGKIAFDHWYPVDVNMNLIKYIYDNMDKQDVDYNVKHAVGLYYGLETPDPEITF
jgi:hypothetical protein